MAEHAHSMSAPSRAASICAQFVAGIALSFLLAIAVIGLETPDPVTSGHAYAVEAVR